MTDAVFQREMLSLGEFLKINMDTRMEQVKAGFAGTLVADIEMNDETDEF